MTADAMMEQVATSFVRGRLLVAASRVRFQLWADRGGSRLAQPHRGREFAEAVGALDRLIASLHDNIGR